MNATFLQNHCVRRHGQTFQEIKSVQGEDKENDIPPKISKQLEEIKERLIFTESQLEEERKSMKELNFKVSEPFTKILQSVSCSVFSVLSILHVCILHGIMSCWESKI